MLSDLVFVLRHIVKILDEYNLVDLYANFANTLQQIASSSTPELQTALKDYRSRIREAHKQVEPEGWSYSQLKIFKKFGARAILGNEGFTNFVKALSDNAANTPGAVEEINRQREEISKILNNSRNVLSSLNELAEEMELEAGQSVIQVVFDEEVSVDTLKDLFEQSKEWKDIIRAYSLLAGIAPEATTIIATSKGSPYTIWLKTAQLVGETLCATIKPFIGLYKEILEAKEKAITLEDMKVGVDGKKFELFKAIDEYERKKIGEIITDVVAINKNDGISPEQRNEALTALTKAGPNLYQFITKGGKVDVSENSDSKKVFNSFKLESSYQETFQLKGRVQKLLEEKAQSIKEDDKATEVTQESENPTERRKGKRSSPKDS